MAATWQQSTFSKENTLVWWDSTIYNIWKQIVDAFFNNECRKLFLVSAIVDLLDLGRGEKLVRQGGGGGGGLVHS